jgi:hypothetical protein
MYQIIKTTLCSMALFVTLSVCAQNNSTPPEEYEKLWQQVEAFNNDGLPQSALKAAEEIYALAV